MKVRIHSFGLYTKCEDSPQILVHEVFVSSDSQCWRGCDDSWDLATCLQNGSEVWLKVRKAWGVANVNNALRMPWFTRHVLQGCPREGKCLPKGSGCVRSCFLFPLLQPLMALSGILTGSLESKPPLECGCPRSWRPPRAFPSPPHSHSGSSDSSAWPV